VWTCDLILRYRAPECLLTDGYYGAEMDMWGAGCVFFEITRYVHESEVVVYLSWFPMNYVRVRRFLASQLVPVVPGHE
jgi:hypothetical protein